jgi:hypothetical protein
MCVPDRSRRPVGRPVRRDPPALAYVYDKGADKQDEQSISRSGGAGRGPLRGPSLVLRRGNIASRFFTYWRCWLEKGMARLRRCLVFVRNESQTVARMPAVKIEGGGDVNFRAEVTA